MSGSGDARIVLLKGDGSQGRSSLADAVYPSRHSSILKAFLGTFASVTGSYIIVLWRSRPHDRIGSARENDIPGSKDPGAERNHATSVFGRVIDCRDSGAWVSGGRVSGIDCASS